jgi:hypothetical protein
MLPQFWGFILHFSTYPGLATVPYMAIYLNFLTHFLDVLAWLHLALRGTVVLS